MRVREIGIPLYTNVGTAIEVTHGFNATACPKQSQKKGNLLLKKQLWRHACV